MTEIKEFKAKDWKQVWDIIRPVFRAGETYAFSINIQEDEAYRAWVELPQVTFVAVDDEGRIVGSYYLKPNQPSAGSHVCNCGYIVSEQARGKGIASQMCLDSQERALTLGFRAMQYNFVASTNDGAVRLWKKHGFNIVGRLPGAFKHPRHGYVDAYVMFKELTT